MYIVLAARKYCRRPLFDTAVSFGQIGGFRAYKRFINFKEIVNRELLSTISLESDIELIFAIGFKQFFDKDKHHCNILV